MSTNGQVQGCRIDARQQTKRGNAPIRIGFGHLVAMTCLMAVPITANAATGTPPSVVVFDQALGGTKAVDVAYAFLPSKGYVAVLPSDEAGNPIRKPIGTAEVGGGDHRNVKITLADPPKSGQKLWIALYRDADSKAGFDPSGDKAIWDDKLPSENAFMVK